MAQRLEDLYVWQLADSIRREVHAIVASRADRLDRRFCSQMTDAASSVPRNVAEGFGRYRHREFARFIDIARGSVFEVQDLARDGIIRGYWAETDVVSLASRCAQTIAALTSFSRYLKTHADPTLKRQTRR
jgi:four helix bundle protein